MTPRWATTAIFAANGAALGTWIAHIPWVQLRFTLSSATMGLLLVSMSVAVMIVMPFAGRAVVKHGSQRLARAGGVACSLASSCPCSPRSRCSWPPHCSSSAPPAPPWTSP